MSCRILLLILLCCTARMGHADAYFKTHEFTLENGLKLIVREDHRVPLVVSQIWYKVGASYEHNGSSGVSHMLEHMMFRGTPKHPAGQLSRIIAEHGGQQNAFTGYDYTSFYQQLDVSQLPLCFELESDRMQNLNFLPEEFEREHRVVMEERRLRVDDNPLALAREFFFGASYLNNPHQHPIIGWASDINELTLKDVKEWYQSYYAPNNAVLVVVGDVEPNEVLSLVNHYFGSIPKRSIPILKPRTEPPHVGEKRIIVELQAEVPYLFMGYNLPVINDADEPWEPYALRVLMMALDGGESSRFSEKLLRGKSVAANISSWYNPFQLFSTQYTLLAASTQGHSLENLEQALLEEIYRLHKERLSEEELNRIKAIATADYIYKQDSMMNQANEIGALESANLPWKLNESYVDNLKSVTAEQVQFVARKYLIPERLTIAYLNPKVKRSVP
jgi:zinc protease